MPPAPQRPAPFIVGVGRSGTTLLRLMLDAHPEMAIPPETHFIPDAVQACREQDGEARDDRDEAEEPRDAFMRALTCRRTWRDSGVDEGALREEIEAIRPFDVSAGLRAFYGVYAGMFGKPRWGDKTPLYVRSMKLIHEVLPEARFVHLIRDGRDVAVSIKDLWFGPDSVEDAAEWWRAQIVSARRDAAELPPSHYMEVRYEDLVATPVPELRAVCAFVDLSWDPAILGYHATAGERIKEVGRAVSLPDGRTVSAEEREEIFSLTSEPPRRDRTGRWKREMSDADRFRFEEVAGGLLEELGYGAGERVESASS